MLTNFKSACFVHRLEIVAQLIHNLLLHTVVRQLLLSIVRSYLQILITYIYDF